MFRKRDPQSVLIETSHLIPREKRARIDATWARAFREQALPLIEEAPFAPLFHEGNGRPNAPVQVVVGTLILKEMFDLTDMEALEQLEFNILWQHALRLTPEDAHLCQKTLHNFRVRVMEHGDNGARLAFERMTDAIIVVLGTRVERQRLDSTHVLSNFAILTRLGLFCETIRVALVALRRAHPKLFKCLSKVARGRYLKDDGTETTRFRDAKAEVARRRLGTCARDVFRILSLCKGKAAAELPEIVQLQRLFDDQCEAVKSECAPGADDDDAGEGGAPVIVKEPKAISSASLQTPHDSDVTYSGHKGKGYEVQIAETCHEKNAVEIITHVEVTQSCDSDAAATLPTIEALAERGLQPEQLVADTTYGSAENAVAAAKLGTELVSPLAGSKVEAAEEPKDRPLTDGDFKIDARLESPATCPAGHEASSQQPLESRPNTVELRFDASLCAACPLASRCPAKQKAGAEEAVVLVNLERANIEQRRRAEALGELKPRYDIRAGCEATNSELKRRHGLRKLRVRGWARVVFATYFKALACNFKRMLYAVLGGCPVVGATA